MAPDRATVDAFHAAALEAGGRDNGAPGVREIYHPHYYGAYVLDPDGNNIEAVCHTPGLAAQRSYGYSRQRLAAVLGDQQQVLEAHAADALDALDARLDRDHVSRDERVAAGEPEAGRLVHLEADPVAEAEVEAVRERLPGARVRWVGWPARSMISAAVS